MGTGTPTPALHALAARVEVLERANRRWRRSAAVTATLAGALLLTGALPSGGPRSAVEAQRFVLRDATGRVRASLGVRGDGSPSLSFYDRRAATRLIVGLEGDDPAVGFLDAAGRGRVQLGLGENGSPHVSLYDAGERGRAQLGLDDDGAPSLTLSDRDRKAAIWLAVEGDDAPGLHLQDRRGKIVFKAP